MKPYKETLINTLEAKKERLLEEVEMANQEIAMATRNLEIFKGTIDRVTLDIEFINQLLAQLTFDPTNTPPGDFDYMDSDVA